MSDLTQDRRRPRAAFSCAAIAALGLLFSGCDRAATPASGTPGIVGVPATPGEFACGAPAAAIAALPRDAAAVRQRLQPQVVDLEGVVVGNFQGGLRGFFLQSAAGTDDGDPATPEGVFVEYEGESPAPRVGRRLRVRGEWTASDDAVRAALALRRIAQARDCGEAAVPDAVVLDEPPRDWQRYAGMRIRIPGPLALTANEQLLRYGELWLSFDGRLVTPTEIVMPGGAVQTRLDHDARRLLIVDDGRAGDYPRRLWHLPAEPGAHAPYRVGSQVSGVEGVLDQRFGSWRLQLTQPLGAVEQAPRPAAPARTGDTLRIASFNVLNFFNGDGSGGGFPTERGAGSRNDLRRQRDKLVAAMRELDADVYALMEIENDGYDSQSALAELAAALSEPANGDADGEPATGAYAVIDAGTPRLGSDAIAVGLIYRASAVRPIGAPAMLRAAPFDRDSRVPLAQAFAPLRSGQGVETRVENRSTAETRAADSADAASDADEANDPDVAAATAAANSDRIANGGTARGLQEEGAPFIVVVNHFKSKGCRDATGDNADAGDGQSCYAAARMASAEVLRGWLETLPGERAGLGPPQTLILGDLNAYSREDPLSVLTGRGFVDLVAQHGNAHTYVFRGQAGRLDHALGGQDIAGRLAAAGVWHINADELPEFDYDGDARSGRQLYAPDPFRSSDHDPVWIDLIR